MSAASHVTDMLVAVPVVILACQAGALLFRRLGQPPVVGEIAMGIMLGPSLLGWLWPAAQQWLFPPGLMPLIQALGQLGLLSFMFLVGRELDLRVLRGQSRLAVAVSQVGIALPMALGSLLALAMYDTLAPEGVSKLPFVLFLAVAMSITAFPVLARILTDRGIYHTPLGALALACAAVDDVMAWCLLAVVVAVSTSSTPMDAVTTAALSVLFVSVMLLVVRPLLARLADRAERSVESVVLVAVFSGLCLAALATDKIGIHALFGAFLFGVVTPRNSPAVERASARLRAVAVPILLPLFFVYAGLRTDIGMLAADPVQWLWLAAVLAVAVIGKWGGASTAARVAGRPWRESLSIGALMNCRGLTELVVLNIGLELGVIGPQVFTMMVIMALLTTAVTSPALTRLRAAGSGAPPPAKEPEAAEPARV